MYKFVLFWSVFSFFTIRAQDPHPAFRQYDVEDGLASSIVYQVKQDSKGYMWFATDNGISKFNGYEFENFSMSNGLPDNTIFEIFEDKKGRVWFLSLSNKIVYYDKGKMHIYKYNDVLGSNISKHIKTSFCVTENGSVFLGLAHYGICEITENGKLKLHLAQDSAGPSGKIIEPVEGSYIFSNNFLSKGDGNVVFKTSILQRTVNLPGSFRTMQSTARTIKLKSNKLLLNIENKLFIIDASGNLTTEEFNSRIQWIYEDQDQDVWIGTSRDGVYLINNGDFKTKKNYLKNLSITGIIQDTESGLWFTTEGNSIHYAPSKHVLTYDQTSGLGDAHATSLASDNHSLFVGLQNAFIYKISHSGNVMSLKKKEVSKDILSLYYNDKTSELFYSSLQARGILKDGHIRERSDVSYYKLLQEDEHTYWAINNLGLFKIVDFSINQLKLPYSEKRKRMNALIWKNKHTLLLGCIDGLWEFNIGTNTYKHVGEKHPLLRNRVLDLKYIKDSILLIATKGTGLLIRYKNGKVEQLNTSKGLSSDNVKKIMVDNSFIWLATDNGLNRLALRTSKIEKSKIRVFTTHDGLISNVINDMHQFNNHLWVATDKGLSFFNSALPDVVHYELPLYINKILINDRRTSVKNKYSLNYFENNIRISFIALGYKNAKKLQYRYKMVGLDTSWIYSAVRDIQFTTLPPGNYKFIVSVLNSNGKWSRNVNTDFIIATPFWKMWWFILLCMGCGMYLIIYSVKYWLKKKQREKDKHHEITRVLLNLKLKALRAQMNPHFIFNVMNSIQYFIMHKNDEGAHRYLSKFSKLIRIILNNSEKNTIPLSEEIKALELYLSLEAMRFEERFNYEIIIDTSLDINQVEIPSMLIQPYVENAIKHGILPSPNSGKIKIEIVKQDNLLKCVIEDNGVGRSFSYKASNQSEHRSFGTFITKERLSALNELHNTDVFELITDLIDANGDPLGTRVEIHVPLVQ